MQLNLDQNEVAALIDALSQYIPMLREELGSTEQYEMKQSLHAQEDALTAVLTRLGGAVPDASTSMPDLGADNPPWGGGGLDR
ncbi:MAG TPA: hypothetical protein VGE04_05855 [Chloroflexia bacterium]